MTMTTDGKNDNVFAVTIIMSKNSYPDLIDLQLKTIPWK